MTEQQYSGGCLCGHIRFQASGQPGNPHSCSCEFCPRCGSTLGAVDDEPTIALVTGSFDQSDLPALRPTAHAFVDGCPDGWKIDGIV